LVNLVGAARVTAPLGDDILAVLRGRLSAIVHIHPDGEVIVARPAADALSMLRASLLAVMVWATFGAVLHGLPFFEKHGPMLVHALFFVKNNFRSHTSLSRSVKIIPLALKW
jgi:hypothetical protein